MFYLVDDGTLDTVLECGECLTQLRYNFSAFDGYTGYPNSEYEEFLEWTFADAKATHECGVC